MKIHAHIEVSGIKVNDVVVEDVMLDYDVELSAEEISTVITKYADVITQLLDR